MQDQNNARGPIVQMNTESHIRLQMLNAIRRERMAHKLPSEGFPNPILIPLRAKYRQR